MAEENNGGAGNGAGAGEGQGGNGAGAGTQTPVTNADGTVTIGDKTFIPKESYDVVAEKQREANRRLEQFDKEKADADKKKLEDEGKFKELAEAEAAKRVDLETRYTRERKVNALKLAAVQAGTVDPEAVATLANLDGITVSEDGSVDAASVKTVVDTLKKEKAYLFGTPGAGGQPPRKPDVGNGGGGAGEGGSGGGKTFYRSQLKDSTFYQANRADILEAAKEGRIVNDVS